MDKITSAITKNFESPIEIQDTFKTNKDAIKFLEDLIWRKVPVSPFDKTSKVYKCKKGRYKCKNTEKYFTVTTGTLFEGTKIKLFKWFIAIFYVNSDRKGITSTCLAKNINVSQKTAWYMLQKIRYAMEFESKHKLTGTSEVDEYYAGGSLSNMHYDKKLEAKSKGTFQNKIPMQGFVERDGNIIFRVVPNTEMDTLCAGVLKYVERGSTLYTDENQSYNRLDNFYNHKYVTHSKGNYVSKKNIDIHTNTIESGWAILDRNIKSHIKITEKHAQNYLHEVGFKYNTRKMDCGDATIWFLQNVEGTRITWKDIHNGEYRQLDRDKKRAA